MEVLIALASAVFSSFLVAPDLYSHGPYEFEQQYSSLKECQIESYGSNDICTTEAPYQRYVQIDKPINTSTKPLEYIECDYWAGCYKKEE